MQKGQVQASRRVRRPCAGGLISPSSIAVPSSKLSPPVCKLWSPACKRQQNAQLLQITHWGLFFFFSPIDKGCDICRFSLPLQLKSDQILSETARTVMNKQKLHQYMSKSSWPETEHAIIIMYFLYLFKEVYLQ